MQGPEFTADGVVYQDINHMNAEHIDRGRPRLDEEEVKRRRLAEPGRRVPSNESCPTWSLAPGNSQYLVLMGLILSVQWTPPKMYTKKNNLLAFADRYGKVRRWISGILARNEFETSFQSRQFTRAVEYLYELGHQNEVITAVMHILTYTDKYKPDDDDDDFDDQHDFSNGHPE